MKWNMIPLLGVAAMAMLTSCEKKGPVERAGEKIDNAVEKAKDAVDPKGPAEKLGEKIDNATR